MNKLRFIYLRDQNKQPHACVAVAFNKKTKQVVYALSSLNPMDKFNREVARDLAVGRLLQRGNELDLSDLENPDCHTITRVILKDLLTLDNDDLPSRARKLAKRWLAKDAEYQKQDEQENVRQEKSSKVVALYGGHKKEYDVKERKNAIDNGLI